VETVIFERLLPFASTETLEPVTVAGAIVDLWALCDTADGRDGLNRFMQQMHMYGRVCVA